MKTVIVIFGASGDLTGRKLMPALYKLYKRGVISRDFNIIATGRKEFTNIEYVNFIRSKGEYDDTNFFDIIRYITADPLQTEDYQKIKSALDSHKPASHIFYLATPPSLYETIIDNLGKNSLNKQEDVSLEKDERYSRIIIEKPFGYNLKSGIEMNNLIKKVFDEKQVFRIDHYLGKETVQNILALRFANAVLEPLWSRQHIERVEITAVENMGIGNRGGYYESAGALRDMAQNHLIQLLALVAMEAPLSFADKHFRDEVAKVYKSLKPLENIEIANSVVRGQYMSTVGDGVNIKGYREEKDVTPDSLTETFLAMKIEIDNERWKGVPFYIRTGKQMPTKVTEIVIHFRKIKNNLFGCLEECPEQNQLIIRIQPNEGLVIKLDMKIPGRGFNVKQVPVEFTYDKMGDFTQDDSYSRLIEDCINGDSTLFTRSDAVELSWRYFDPLLQYWESNNGAPLYGYPAGNWGPPESEKILGGERWTNPCKNLTNTHIYCEL